MTIKFQAKHKSGFTVDSPLTPFIFPDGAAHIKGVDDETEYEYQIADVRGFSNDDMMLLAMWSNACDERGEPTVLLLPYLPGARMDRGVPNGAYVYSDFIRKIVRPDLIITLDPHSKDATFWYPEMQTVRDYENEDSTALRVKRVPYFKVFPVEHIIRREVQDPSTDSKPNNTYQGVIAPDKGAHDRAAAAAKVMGNLPVYTGGKTRDFDTGKILGFHMEDELPDEGRFLIVDDICDGGGTFLALAGATGLPKERLDLWVTHGIFSKGLGELREYFGKIHTTDSFFPVTDSGVFYAGHAEEGWRNIHSYDRDVLVVHKITPYLYPEIQPYYYQED